LTSAIALTNATLPYALNIANKGWKAVCRKDNGFANGVNYVRDQLVCKPVADAFGMDFTAIKSLL
jgi:alanine dehydrogenase